MMGTEWGRKNRSQIFFVAFWLSFAGLFFLCAALASLSTTQMSSIENVPFFQGSLTVTENGITSDMYYYAGVNRMVINGCEADTSCPPDWLGWGDDSCNKYFSNCHSCRTAKGSATFPFVMAILGQVGQVATDLTRSTGILLLLILSCSCFVLSSNVLTSHCLQRARTCIARNCKLPSLSLLSATLITITLS